MCYSHKVFLYPNRVLTDFTLCYFTHLYVANDELLKNLKPLLASLQTTIDENAENGLGENQLKDQKRFVKRIK